MLQRLKVVWRIISVNKSLAVFESHYVVNNIALMFSYVLKYICEKVDALFFMKYLQNLELHA